MAVREALLTLTEVKAETLLSRSTIYVQMRQGRFPTPLKTGLKKIGWRPGDIDEWLAQCPRATGDLGERFDAE